MMTAEEIKVRFGLQPHPREGGWYVRSYEAAEMVSVERYGGLRRTGTAIFYLLESTTFSEMHRLQSDEIFHVYAGNPVEMLQLELEQPGKRVLLGSEFWRGYELQVVVPRGVWQGSRLVAGGQWALLGCTVSPGFEYEDYEAGSRAELVAGWPEWREMIEGLTRE